MTPRSLKGLFLLLIVSLLLSACQADSTLTVTPAATPGDLPAETEAAPAQTETPAMTATPTQPLVDLSTVVKGQTVEFWHPWQGNMAGQVEKLAEEFNRTNEWGMKVTVRPLYNSEALFEVVSAGLKDDPKALPQVIAANSDQLALWSSKNKAVVDLTLFVANGQYGLGSEATAAFLPVFWTQDQQGSLRLGLPAARTARVIFYNQTWAQELGFSTPPNTPEQFKKQACEAAKKNGTLKVEEKYGTGGWLIDDDPLTTLSWMQAFGANPIPASEDQPYRFESEAGEKAVVFLRNMFDQSCAWVGRKTDPYEYFTDRMALFYTGTLADIPVQAGWQGKANSKDQWTVLPFPGQDGKPVVLASGASYALLQTGDEKKQLAGWLWMRWLEDPQRSARLAEAQPSLPVSSAVSAALSSKRSSFPWSALLPMVDAARPAPGLASWRDARRMLEDAAWQIYHLPAEGLDKVLPQTLPQLDQAVLELLKSPQ